MFVSIFFFFFARPFRSFALGLLRNRMLRTPGEEREKERPVNPISAERKTVAKPRSKRLLLISHRRSGSAAIWIDYVQRIKKRNYLPIFCCTFLFYSFRTRQTF